MPFQRRLPPSARLVPLTCSVKVPAPALTKGGLRLVKIGTGLVIVKVRLFERPPLAEGLTTVNAWAPTVVI